MRTGFTAFIGMIALLAIQPPAGAHPHVFVDVDVELDVAADGGLRGINYDWTFDDMYSAFVVQGLPRASGAPTEAALAKVAEAIIERLDDADYFTKAAAEGHELQATGAQHARASFADGRLRLTFTVALRAIGGAADKVNVQVFDPQYVVAVSVRDSVRVRGPSRCTHQLLRAGPLDPNDARQLDDSLRTNQLAANFGSKLATTIALDCRVAK
ncbi:MAG: DUF1007 family protein [Beijerinckiaceae bacterium]|nr:DUF1007 family protein [Beijerinckiaceae bacterium]